MFTLKHELSPMSHKPNATLVIGGCRSGKSSHALQLGEQTQGLRKAFVATCQPLDTEMKSRVKRHQKERGEHWQTIEAPEHIVDAIKNHGPETDIMLIDCLTLWVSNLMAIHKTEDRIIQEIDKLHDAVQSPPCPIILVTNEVGTGIVPENQLARQFRDLTGWCNQKIASGCKEVIWMVAGIPVKIADRE